jgi:hypothetical protein
VESMCCSDEGDCETSERRQALQSNQSSKTGCKVESERRVLSRANLAGSQIALKVGFQVVCSLSDDSDTAANFLTAVIIFDAPEGSFASCLFVAVVLTVIVAGRAKSQKHVCSEVSFVSPPTSNLVTHFSCVQFSSANNNPATQLANTSSVTPTKNPSSNCPKASYTSSAPDRSKATRNSSSKTLLPRSDAPARNSSTSSSSNVFTKKAKQSS